MANNATIARRLAAQSWGQPDRQEKLAEGIWKFDTPGHGGIVIDVCVCPEPMQFKKFNDVVYIRNNSNRYRILEQHFAAFEEDCEAQIVEWIFADKVVTPKRQQGYLNKDLPFDEWRKWYIGCLRETLETWHPEVLEKYPVPGVR